jgi:signal transduction histidine kinase
MKIEEQLIELQSTVKRRIKELILPIVIFTVGTFFLLFLSLYSVTSAQDEKGIENSEKLVAAILGEKLQHLSILSLDYTYSDAAFEHLVIEFEQEWIDDNIGEYLHDVQGFSVTYVVDDNNKTISATEYGETQNVDALQKFPKLEAAINDLRNSYDPLQNTSSRYDVINDIAGNVYLVGLGIVLPDYSEFMTADIQDYINTKTVVVLAYKLDEYYLKALSERFNLPKFEYAKTVDDLAPNYALYELTSFAGETVAKLAWMPELQGSILLMQTLKNSALVFLALIALSIFIGVRGTKLLAILNKGLKDFGESRQIAMDYEGAISSLVQGEFLYELSVVEALNKIAENASKTANVERVGVWQYDREKNSMTTLCRYYGSSGPLEDSIEFDLTNYPDFVKTFQKSEAFFVDDVWSNPIMKDLGLLCFEEQGPLTFYGVPIIRHRRKVGLVYFATYEKDFDWSDEKKRFASSITDIVSLILDVHTRNLIEVELRRAKNKAEMANVAKTDFLANMSHELRTPLNAVIGFSDLMKQQIFGKLGSDQYVEYVDDINLSARHLLSLINEILDVAKTESGTYEIYPSDINLQQEFGNAVRLLKGRFREKPFEAEIDIEDGLEVIVADPKCFRQIALNILSNAIKFSDENCQIVIKAVREKDTILLSFQDNGIGIPREKQEEIFKAFHQVESALARRFEGTGLGLAITKALVELHHGEIRLDSAPGLGTTIYVSLPINLMETDDNAQSAA